MACSPNNLHWKNMRKLCSVELFTSRRLSSFEGLIKEELSQLMSELLKSSQEKGLVTLRKPVREFTFNVITRILMRKAYFGPKRTTSRDCAAAEFVELMSLVPKKLGEFCIGDLYPSFSRFNVFRWRNIRQKLDTFLENILEDHLQRKSGSEDFLDVLISHFGLDRRQDIKANLLDLLIGGTDTTPAVIEWGMAELLRNPAVLQKAQAELMSKVGTRMVEFDDIPQLEFMHAIVKEIMRLHPPVPMLLPHFSTQDCTLGSYNIPAKTMVLVNTYAIGRDENIWPDPESFRPERFLGSSINVHGFNFELLPFGAGRRICPGLSMGLRSVHFAMCNLVHLFIWSYPEGATAGDQEMDSMPGIINCMATPLQAKVAPRFVL